MEDSTLAAETLTEPVAAASSEEKADVKDFITLEECFKRIVRGDPVEFEVENLNNILRRELQVNFYYLKPRLKSIIPFMLVHFIKCWPGWHKSNNYLSKQITFDNWFAKFKEYLVFKMNYLIKNDYEKVQNLLKSNQPIDDILFKIDNSTQMDIPAEKCIAPYSICIQGLPKMLNSLVFCEGLKDSIMVKEYKISMENDIKTKQLLNWPHVEVEFSCKELRFKRRNVHDFKRFLMVSSEKIAFKKTEPFIEEVDIIDESIDRTVYTINTLREYCDTYVQILKKHQETMELTDEYIADTEALFGEFIRDIEELDMNSMATNTFVVFNIGQCGYARNKTVRTSTHAVCFAESITPKLNLALFSFTGLMDENSDTPFQGLQDVSDSTDKELIKSLTPTLKYRCTFCEKRFYKKTDITEHFKAKHCVEQPVLCFKCKLQMDVPTICEMRWSHSCQGKDKNGSPAEVSGSKR